MQHCLGLTESASIWIETRWPYLSWVMWGEQLVLPGPGNVAGCMHLTRARQCHFLLVFSPELPWNHRVKPVRVARPSCNDGLWNAIPVLPLSPQKPDTEQRGGGSGILGALWAPPFLRESACAMQRGSMLATYTTRVGCVAVSTRMTLHTQQVPLSAQHPKWSAFSWQCFQQCIVVACNFCRRQQCECLVALAAGAVAKSCDSCLKRAGWLWIWWIEKDRVVFKFLGFIFFKPYLLEGQ